MQNNQISRAHFQKFILFNLLLGRGDANEENNVIDEDGMLMAIDNEKIGNETTDSRLVKKHKEMQFDIDVIKEFLKLQIEDNIEQAFSEVEENNSGRTIHCKETIKENFARIRKVFDQQEKIIVGDLVQALVRQK